MGRKASTEEQEDFLRYLRTGKYEMNLLEHSFSGANKNPDRTSESVVFRDVEPHRETGEPVERIWEMSFSSKYGRPTPKDDDVFMALTKLAKGAEFADRKVPFSSYRIIKILDWPDNGDSYKAIDAAFNRIGGVWIVATNYWYDNEEKEYVDRKFGIIDDVLLYERDKYDKARRKAIAEGKERPLSWFLWSEVMWGSFQAGYMATVDIDKCRSISHPVGRKLYRYLGKQFYRDRHTHRIDVCKLGIEKLGYKEGTPRKEVKRMLATPIAALEQRGLFGLQHEFVTSYGKCEVVFRKTESKATKSNRVHSRVVEKLTSLGLSKKAAEKAEARHTLERIKEDVEVATFMERRGMVKQSLAGLLHRMLESDEPWARPDGFVSSVERKRREAKSAEKKRLEDAAKIEKEKAEDDALIEKMDKFETFLASLGGRKEREAFAEESLEASSVHKRLYLKNIKSGHREVADDWREQAMVSHWEKTRKTADCSEGVLFER